MGSKIYIRDRSKDGIVPVEVRRREETVQFDTDEGPRPKTTTEGIAKLHPAFKKGGIVTAANASSINGEAAAVVVTSKKKAEELDVKSIAYWKAEALAGMAPGTMGIGPMTTAKKVSAEIRMRIEDFDLIEASEAFAARSLIMSRELSFTIPKISVNGGAVVLGHPVGASGCRILVTLLHETDKRDTKRGPATLCVGDGMSCAAIVERKWHKREDER